MISQHAVRSPTSKCTRAIPPLEEFLAGATFTFFFFSIQARGKFKPKSKVIPKENLISHEETKKCINIGPDFSSKNK